MLTCLLLRFFVGFMNVVIFIVIDSCWRLEIVPLVMRMIILSDYRNYIPTVNPDESFLFWEILIWNIVNGSTFCSGYKAVSLSFFV